jgi:xylulokinase
LAGVGTGIYRSVCEGCDKTVKVTSSTQPIAKNVDRYEGYYGIFRQLYPSLKRHFRTVSDYVAKLGAS